ncbi:hypothetical protein [Paludibaculum fermentans]|uniref:hypothetical protein n=1 Tax=Paludibaculum fermentans TaxID=1473598 RepID=UPI003EB987A4
MSSGTCSFRSSAIQLALAAFLPLVPLYACDCKAPPVPEAVRQAAAVFTGQVIERQELAPSEYGRHRYRIRFKVMSIWKGPDSKELAVYDQNPAGDCGGWGFKLGKEYVVFARKIQATKHVIVRVEDRNVEWPDPWKGVLPVGRRILISGQCTHTAEIGSVAATRIIQELGKPRHPVR